MTAQLDMFNMPLAAPALPPAPAMIGNVHWLVVTTTRARTACGVLVEAYHTKERAADATEGGRIQCTHDFYDGTVTCQRCREVI